jgi:tol-pal system protein YbgF
MKKSLLLFSFVCLNYCFVSSASARDVQMRERSDDMPSINVSNPSAAAPASSNTQQLSTEERLSRLERILDNQGLVEMLVRIDNLQNELQILRGEIELHAHELEDIKQRQRDLYVDIDRRLLRLERGGTDSGAVNSPSSGSTAKGATSAEVKSGAAVTTAAAVAPSGAGDLANEQQSYQAAFDLLRELRYDQAVTAFQGFIKSYPNGRYAHIAQYWIGEANYAQRNFKEAIKDYQKLIDKYPNSPKLAEAMLKIGYSQYELKDMKQAEATLNQLIKSYPGTTEAGQAQNLIQKIRLKR